MVKVWYHTPQMMSLQNPVSSAWLKKLWQLSGQYVVIQVWHHTHQIMSHQNLVKSVWYNKSWQLSDQYLVYQVWYYKPQMMTHQNLVSSAWYNKPWQLSYHNVKFKSCTIHPRWCHKKIWSVQPDTINHGNSHVIMWRFPSGTIYPR